MKTLTELIQNYRNGIPDSDSEILKRMEPLVKGYASRIHCMEREDSTQEYVSYSVKDIAIFKFFILRR